MQHPVLTANMLFVKPRCYDMKTGVPNEKSSTTETVLIPMPLTEVRRSMISCVGIFLIGARS